MQTYLTFLEQLLINIAIFPPLKWIIIANVATFITLMIIRISKWKY